MSPVNVMAAGVMIMIKSELMPLSVLRCVAFLVAAFFMFAFLQLTLRS